VVVIDRLLRMNLHTLTKNKIEILFCSIICQIKKYFLYDRCNILDQTSLSRMPKLFRDLFILTLVMTASCLDAIEDNVTATMEMSISIVTSTSTSIRTTIIEENALPSVTTQDDGILKNLSHASSLSPSPSSDTVWECPNITKAGVECSCDFPHTLRCTGDRTALQVITTGDCHQYNRYYLL